MKLLTEGNTKILKGERFGYKSFILHLAPYKLSGYNVCPSASKGCAAACLNTAGRGRFDRTRAARIRKTKWFFENRNDFMWQLSKDIYSAIRKAEREELIPVIRLNGTSDIRWETIPVPCSIGSNEPLANYYPNIMSEFPEIQFYDYTKLINRVNIPKNYHLTFSRSESNDDNVTVALDKGMNVAVIFGGKELPKKYLGRKVFNGDESDLRFIDPKNVIVGLTAKGKGKKDNSNFVVTL